MQLTDTQLVVLSAAAQRPSGHLLPLPATCRAKGGAVDKVVAGLVNRGLATLVKGGYLREIPAGAEPWKMDDAGEPLYPFITPASLAAIVVEPEEGAPEAPAATEAEDNGEAAATAAEVAPTAGADAEPAAKPTPRPGTKQALLIELLKRPEGATVEQIAEATGWQHHTIRGAIAGAVKKKLGLTVTAERIRHVGPNARGGTTVYRITGPAPVAG